MTEQTIRITTFPTYQIVRNVLHGRAEIELMLSSQLDCQHDYQLTPQDMQKLAKADFMIVKVIGMEAFLGALVKQPNPNIHNIDSSPGI